MNTEASASFRFRLREAAKAALTLGDELLQASQDASEPNNNQLHVLRSLENNLDVALTIYAKQVKPCATS